MNIFEFEIPDHTTRREWAVYVILAKGKKDKDILLYVGKVGDNRDGCNPIISRIGNHFSHNKIHSQMRNKISQTVDNNTTDYDYKIFYATFGNYSSDSQQADKDRVNELERRLNKYIKENINDKQENFKLLNPYKGVGVSKEKKAAREKLITDADMLTLKALADKAIK
jgi:hypothetical protein